MPKIINLTFIEDYWVAGLLFSAGESIAVTFLGGGDLMRCRWEDVVLEVPNFLVKVEWQL
jgi:hypothetical protein